jgi:hypothetical protein
MQQIKHGAGIITMGMVWSNLADVLLSKEKVNALEENELTKFLTKIISNPHSNKYLRSC